MILAANPAVNRCQSQSTDNRGTFANFRGTFANFRGTFGHFWQITGVPLANYRGTFGQLPGYLWAFLVNYRGTFGHFRGTFCQLPGYLLETTGVPFGCFRGAFGKEPGYLWPKYAFVMKFFDKGTPETCNPVQFLPVLTMATPLHYIGNRWAAAQSGLESGIDLSFTLYLRFQWQALLVAFMTLPTLKRYSSISRAATLFCVLLERNLL